MKKSTFLLTTLIAIASPALATNIEKQAKETIEILKEGNPYNKKKLQKNIRNIIEEISGVQNSKKEIDSCIKLVKKIFDDKNNAKIYSDALDLVRTIEKQKHLNAQSLEDLITIVSKFMKNNSFKLRTKSILEDLEEKAFDMRLQQQQALVNDLQKEKYEKIAPKIEKKQPTTKPRYFESTYEKELADQKKESEFFNNIILNTEEVIREYKDLMVEAVKNDNEKIVNRAEKIYEIIQQKNDEEKAHIYKNITNNTLEYLAENKDYFLLQPNIKTIFVRFATDIPLSELSTSKLSKEYLREVALILSKAYQLDAKEKINSKKIDDVLNVSTKELIKNVNKKNGGKNIKVPKVTTQNAPAILNDIIEKQQLEMNQKEERSAKEIEQKKQLLSEEKIKNHGRTEQNKILATMSKEEIMKKLKDIDHRNGPNDNESLLQVQDDIDFNLAVLANANLGDQFWLYAGSNIEAFVHFTKDKMEKKKISSYINKKCKEIAENKDLSVKQRGHINDLITFTKVKTK